jgi:N-formylmaleamate deformylase
MPLWPTSDVTANSIRLHYTRTGATSGKPAVVLTHGFSDNGLCWTPVAEILADDYDVIMIDARGHGRSEAPAHGYGSAEHAADIAGVIAVLGLRRPAILGHSMGAATALALAGLYPDVPGAILLEDPPAFWSAPPALPVPGDARAAQRHNWITDLKSKTREELIVAQHRDAPSWSEAELGPWADSKLQLSLNVLSGGPSAAVDWPATVRRITCPALLITADPERGAIVTDATAAALQELVPQVRVAHIAGAGHNIRREQFDRYMQIVRGFLAETAAEG